MKKTTIFEYLNGSLSKEASSLLEEWASASAENRARLDEIKLYWDKSADAFQKTDPDVNMAWENVRASTLEKDGDERKDRVSLLQVISRIAALIVIAAGLGFAGMYISDRIAYNNTPQITYQAGDEVKALELDDGSVVWLNRHSELSVYAGFNRRNRRVELSGEAFFEVSRNPEKPFIVNSGDAVSRVLGTSFNIKESADHIVLSVNSGAVEFYESGKRKAKVRVRGGHTASYSSLHKDISTSGTINQNFLAWKTGQISFKNTPLKTVCEELSEIYGETIVYSIVSEKEQNITGVFTDAPLHEILEIIQLTLDITITEKADTIRLSD